jgi:hypothetical protein
MKLYIHINQAFALITFIKFTNNFIHKFLSGIRPTCPHQTLMFEYFSQLLCVWSPSATHLASMSIAPEALDHCVTRHSPGVDIQIL